MNHFIRKIIIMVVFLLCITFVIVCVFKNKQKKKSTLHEKNSENGTVLTDEEEGTWQNISDNGAELYSFNSITVKVIDAAKKYIMESGYDGKDIYFIFKNSSNSYSSDYVINYMLDMFYPQQYENEHEQLYYVEEVYNCKGVTPSISVGYFAINENGDIVESKYLKTRDELENYNLKPVLSSGDAILLAEDESNIDRAMVKSEELFYYKDNKDILCYRILFDNGTKVYINAITGEVIDE